MSDTARAPWFLFLAALGGLLPLGLMFPYKGHFGLDELPLFGAWFGIGVGFALVYVARLIGRLLKREDGYHG